MRNFGSVLLPAVIAAATLIAAGCGGNTSDGTIQSQVPATAHRAASLLALTEVGSATMPKNRDAYIINAPMLGNYSISELNSTAPMQSIGTVAKIKFSDVTVTLGIGAKASTLAPQDLKRLVELYIAFFNRVPDADGLSFWIDQYRQGMPINQIAESFYSAAIQFSSVTGYSSTMTDADFVKAIYQNVLGRSGATAPPDADVQFWVGELQSGRASKGSLISTMLSSAHSFVDDPTWGFVPKLLDNKFAVGIYFAVQKGLNYNTADESISRSMAIAAAVSPTDTVAAIAQIGVASDLSPVLPLAEPGTDQTAPLGSLVTLDGTNSAAFRGRAPTYKWALTAKPNGSTAVLSNATAAKPKLIPDVSGTYTISLVVNDGVSDSQVKEVRIYADPTKYTFSVSGLTQIDSVTVSSSNFRLSPTLSNNIWNSCFAVSCNSTPEMQLYSSYGGPGIYMAELNVNNMQGSPVSLFTRSFPADQTAGRPATYNVEVDVQTAQLNAMPAGTNAAFAMSQMMSEYAQPGMSGTYTYTFNGVGAERLAPAGWKSNVETQITVTISSSWTDDNGRPVFVTLPVLNTVYRGNYATKLTLSSRLEDYPSLKGQYGTYSISVSNRIAFIR